MPKREGELCFLCFIPNGLTRHVCMLQWVWDLFWSLALLSSIAFAFLCRAGLWKKTKDWNEVWSRDEGNMKVEKRSAYYSEGSWVKVTLTIVDLARTKRRIFYTRWSNERLFRRTVNKFVLIVWRASGEQSFLLHFSKWNRYFFKRLRSFPLTEVNFKWRLPLVHVQDMFINCL